MTTKIRPTVDRLQVLETVLATRGLRPSDLMLALRKGGETKGRFLHELSASQVEEQIAELGGK